MLKNCAKPLNVHKTLVSSMLNPEHVNFKKLGFHAGIEVHHQIRSERKLFCHCPPIMEENPENKDYSFYRYFRPVLGEMGDFDPGMLVEFEKGYRVVYYACERNTCTYEMDETPPFHPDIETIKKGIVLALYFNCSAVAEEIVVNRKQYLDGSITTGFQRTLIVGRDGWIPVNGKKVRITNVHIEEDAARRVNWRETDSRVVFFNLDRLGIPLTEVISDHRDVETPEELLELAKQIGRILRISRIGRRGIGAARQDINLSIRGGNRVEIKGVQDLGMLELLCRREAVRQDSLIKIGKEMRQRGLKKEKFSHTYVDVSHVFKLGKNHRAFATIFHGMKGLFGVEIQPNKDFGLDIFEKSMLITGIRREDHFHSDEAESKAVRKRSTHPSRFPIDRGRFKKICSLINLGPSDAFVVVTGPERRALHALKKIVERVKMAVDGVPQETRRFLPDGNTEFLRVIHGKERIYPDTDTPPIVISSSLVHECRKQVGKRPWEIFKELHDKFRFSHDQVDLLIRDERLEKFQEYTKKLGIEGPIAYRLLVELPRRKRREGMTLRMQTIDEMAELLSRRIISLEQVDLITKTLAKQPELTVNKAAEKLKRSRPSDLEIHALIVKRLSIFDAAKIQSDRNYRRFVVARVVGAILEAVDHSLEAGRIAKQVEKLIDKTVKENE
jgi:glutamyl-tRNA(Gln) amidotransferase subunit E